MRYRLFCCGFEERGDVDRRLLGILKSAGKKLNLFWISTAVKYISMLFRRRMEGK